VGLTSHPTTEGNENVSAETFQSVVIDPDSEIAPALSIETVSSFAGDTETGLVRVDTNYKPTRLSQYPVSLSLVDAVKSAAAILRAALVGVHQSDDADAVALLEALQDVDGDAHDLRTVLLREVRNLPDEV
jgi:hypothetical protein